MKILQLCKKFPWPLKDGESVAVNALSRGLVDLGATMDLLAMNTAKHFTRVDTDVVEGLNQYRNIKWVPIDNRIRPVQALWYLIQGKSYHIQRFISDDFSNTLKQMLIDYPNYDLILLESLYMMPYVDLIRSHTKAKIVLRSHNIEFEIWELLAKNHSNPLYKWYLTRLAKSLKIYELDQLNNISYLMPISTVDAQKYLDYGYKGSIYTLNLGLNLNNYPLHFSSESKVKVEIGFIGSLDWMPNVEGLNWFLTQVWTSAVHKYGDQIKLHIAGRNMPKSIREKASDSVIIHGEVPDAIEFINRFPYFVVPLFSGSGMRVKILEAMALGKVVISTSLGIEGIHATPAKEFLLANQKSEFLSCLDQIVAKKVEYDIMGRNAASFMEDNYSQHLISLKLKQYLSRVIQSKNSIPKS